MHLGFQTEKGLKSLLQEDLITLDSVSQFNVYLFMFIYYQTTGKVIGENFKLVSHT